MTVLYTNHAVHRQAQRNLSDQDVQFVLEHGRHVRCAGALHVFLGRKDIPKSKELRSRFARLEGTTLVMDDTREEPVLITVYRNRRALKQIRLKAKYDRIHTDKGSIYVKRVAKMLEIPRQEAASDS
jgi:hypothetical protein